MTLCLRILRERRGPKSCAHLASRYGGIRTKIQTQPCTHRVKIVLRLIIVASESSGRAFACSLFALEHTGFWAFLAEIPTSRGVPGYQNGAGSRRQCTGASPLVMCKWSRPVCRQESSKGSLRAGEVLKIVVSSCCAIFVMCVFLGVRSKGLANGIK